MVIPVFCESPFWEYMSHPFENILKRVNNYMNYMDMLDNWQLNAKSHTFNPIGLILNSLMYVLEYIKF